MPSLATKAENPVIKLMMIGDSGTGKTGSLISLAEAGYKLRIFDYDNGIDIISNLLKDKPASVLESIQYQSFRDKKKMGPAGPITLGAPQAFTKGVQALDKWDDGSVPSSWPRDHIAVIDSLTAMGRAALDWATAMNPSAKDPRQWYYAAQDALENVIGMMTNEAFPVNLIVISHVDYRTDPAGITTGYATALGKALGPKIPRYFNNLLGVEKIGMGKTTKRIIKTLPTATLTLKTSAPNKLEAEYPIETGLATIFSKLAGKA